MEKKKKNDDNLEIEKANYIKQQDELKKKRERDRDVENGNFLKMQIR